MRHKFLYLITSTLIMLTSTEGAVAALPALPEVAQNTDVHGLAKTYCRQLWQAVNAPGALGYANRASEAFKVAFQGSVDGLQEVLNKVKAQQPINELGDYFDESAHQALQTALNNMKVLGKYKGAPDLDNETQASVNEVFTYCWHQAMLEPSKVTALLIGLQDASPTCIQGYSVRMLCAIHPPKLKGQK